MGQVGEGSGMIETSFAIEILTTLPYHFPSYFKPSQFVRHDLPNAVKVSP